MKDQLVASDVVERAETLMMGVSRGPWKMGNRAYPDVVHTPNGFLWHPGRGEINNTSDGSFIAAARDLVPELVNEPNRPYAVVDDALCAARVSCRAVRRRRPHLACATLGRVTP